MARPGTSYNPFPTKPDPWAVALAKGLISSETQHLTWQPNPPNPPPGVEPGDPDVHRAWMDRYGIPISQPFPCGAELELTLWPRVLNIMWEHVWQFTNPGFDGNPLPREARDATLACDFGLICEAFTLSKAQGYVPENPNKIRDPSLPPGLLVIPGRKRPNEPPWFARFRVPWGCNQYWFNDIPDTKPVLPPRVAETLRILVGARGIFNIGPARAGRIKELDDFVRSITGTPPKPALPPREDETLKILVKVRGPFNIGPGRALRIKHLDDFVRSITRPAP